MPNLPEGRAVTDHSPVDVVRSLHRDPAAVFLLGVLAALVADVADALLNLI